MPTQRLNISRYLRRIATTTVRWLWFLGLSTVLAGVGAYVVSRVIHPVYQATTLVIVDAQGTGDSSYTALLASDQLVVTYMSLITQPVVLQRVASQVGGVSPSALAQRTKVSDEPGTQIIQIQVQDTSPTRAAKLANGIAGAFITVQQEAADATYINAQQELTQKIAQTTDEINSLSSQIAVLQAKDPTDPQIQTLQHQLDGALSNRDSLQALHSQLAGQHLVEVDSVRVFQPATTPTQPDHPKPLFNAEIAAALGLAIAGSLVFLIELLDDRIRTNGELVELVGAPILTTIGDEDEDNVLLSTPNSPRNTPLAATMRTMEMNLTFMGLDEPLRTIAVTSAQRGDGKTTTSINLAVALAWRGKRVLLVDANLLNPQIHRLLDLPNAGGLSLWLTQGATHVPKYTLPYLPNLSVLTSGPTPPNPSQLLGSARMHELLNRNMSDPFGIGSEDVIVIDLPTMGTVETTSLVAGLADGTVIVADETHMRGGLILRAKDALVHANARIVGVVLNRARARQEQKQDTYDYTATEDHVPALERQPMNGVALLTNTTMKQSTTEEIGPPQSHGVARS